MALNDQQRFIVEDAIYECQYAADRYLDTGNKTHAKMLLNTLEYAKEILAEHQDDLVVDGEKEKYNLHMLVPTQLGVLIKMRSEEK